MKQPALQSKYQPGNATVDYASRHTLNDTDDYNSLGYFTKNQWEFWRHNGYLVLKNIAPQENIHNLVETLWDFEEKDPNSPDTWYAPPRREIQMKELTNSGMVELYNHQALWNNRQLAEIHRAFSDIWGTEKLWVTIDRANLNFPVRDDHHFPGFIHWDIDTSLSPRQHNVQGVLALSDTGENTGGFQCIPELFRDFDTWVSGQPADRDPFQPDISGYSITPVNVQAGDLLIFNSMLPHGIRPNHSDRPRMAQYIAMTPALEDNEELRQWRIKSWKERLAPEGYAFPGDPRGWEQKKHKTAELTELGEKLLGLKKWKM